MRISKKFLIIKEHNNGEQNSYHQQGRGFHDGRTCEKSAKIGIYSSCD